MPNIQKQEGETKESGAAASQARPPSINLPKGGGAIRGIGEKFAANPVTGTGSMTVPIATSPGRSGFGPQLSLSYDSGSGNGPFGFGWSLSLPSITRKTDKGLPRYLDGQQQVSDSDEFILSGAEDLVPEFEKDAAGNWVLRDGKYVIYDKLRTVNGVTYNVRRYRPRIEGLFARIERWTNQADTKECFWRSISKDNITTWYGKTENSRILDPSETSHIFSWLICQSYDDKGNAIIYEYVPEDSAGIDKSQAHESNRSPDTRKANHYLKRIVYGNLKPNRDDKWQATDPSTMRNADGLFHEHWMFEVVFDYGEGHYEDLPLDPSKTEAEQHRYVLASKDGQKDNTGQPLWPARQDPFSVYRAGFEVRTYRLCRRALMFHHFPQELGIADCLVRSTEFTYRESPVASFITSVTQSGYVCQPDGNHQNRYLKKSLPPLEFGYTQVPTSDELARLPIREVDAKSLENLPIGLDGTTYQWVDLDGEGISGILTEQAGAWFYKRNLSAIPPRDAAGVEQPNAARFGAIETITARPATTLAAGHAQFMDLAGDGQLDLVQMEGPIRGFYERTDDANWESFRPFTSWPNIDIRDPNLKFIDLNGDGHADIIITEDDVLTWHPSLAEEGFGQALHVSKPLDEEKGPRLVFADGSQSIYVADLSGDGLTDLVRIRNGEVCYWSNHGYGRFGAKVTMDNSPWFDRPDQFDQNRIRLADIDGSGTTDVIYLRNDGVQIYFNQSGNRWSNRVPLPQFPPVDNLTSVQALDLLGNGTACLVWSSSLPSISRHPMFYIALMPEKPHLLAKTANNLGAETRVHFASSTKFYLKDKEDGNPWITKLPFPVHVVERVETYDYISRNRFVTRYAYHHGYFDGHEREFRGFGMVEQRDTEEFASLSASDAFPVGNNIDRLSHVPPVLTKTWFHTGVYDEVDEVSKHLAAEYYGAPDESDPQFDQKWQASEAMLLPDTVLPPGLPPEEACQVCRALKGSMLRQEVYALDGTDREKNPYTVTEQNFTIRALQPTGVNRHGVYFTHTRESISYHYERNPADPRVGHALTLEVDNYGNVLKSLSIGYGRKTGLSPLQGDDKAKQEQLLITYTESDVTHAIDDTVKNPDGSVKYPDDYRTPLPWDIRTFELTGITPENGAQRFSFDDLTRNAFARIVNLAEEQYEWDVDYAAPRKRLIERVCTLYRKDNLIAILPPGELEPLALPGEMYKLAFTPGLAKRTFVDAGKLTQQQLTTVLADEGGYVHFQNDANWWIPSGRVFYSPGTNDNAAAEWAEAKTHFYLPRRYRDPFHKTDGTWITETVVDYDDYDLLLKETRDATGNQVTVGERSYVLPDNTVVPAKPGNDYRVLQPALVMDPNRNRTMAVFDALGLVAGTAVMGKPEDNPSKGDLLDASFKADLTEANLSAFYDAAELQVPAANLLRAATTRIVYDLHRFYRTRLANPQAPNTWEPTYAATLACETHVSDPLPPWGLRIQIGFSYSDGFGREIQMKIQAEPGKLDVNDPQAPIVSPRWVGSGWTIFNNKGKPVRQYEPFFSKRQRSDGTQYSDHRFEFGVKVGVSPILFYDPAERVVATLHPNHTYEKVVFEPWRQVTHDVNDTLREPDLTGTPFDPKSDPDVGHYFASLPDSDYLPTWYDLRTDAAQALLKWPDIDALERPLPENAKRRAAEKTAAEKAVKHADTPTTAHFDALGRPFLTIAHNRVVCADHPDNGKNGHYATRIELDIEGNQRAVRDAITRAWDAQGDEVVDELGRIVMRYAYHMAGQEKDEKGKTTATHRIYQISMEAGARWMLNDVNGKPIRSWDSRGHSFVMRYDPLRRPTGQTVCGTTNESDPRTLSRDLLVDKIEYGEPPATASPAEKHRALQLNLRTRVYTHRDSAGLITNARLDANGNPTEAYDFKGNLLRSTRQLVQSYTDIPDWKNNPAVETETFESSTCYDALNRPVQSVAPQSSLGRAKRNVIQPVFNEANLLERVDVWLELATEPTGLLDPTAEAPSPVGVADIDYDAKGQRLRIDYKNGASTHYRYDPETFRLIRLRTVRGRQSAPDCAPALEPRTCEDPPAICQRLANSACDVQDLKYAYDPAGNTTRIQDDAQQIVYFSNRRVEPSNDYTYDAIYRLIEATGREHLGQGNAPIPHSSDDALRCRLPHPGDGNAMSRYVERYVYGAVGNFREMRHRRSDAVAPGWRRGYAYDESSLIEDGVSNALLKVSNRLSSTTVDVEGNAPVTEPYVHDAHGNMTRMPHLPLMRWDHRDRLLATAKQVVNNGIPETTWYVYDASGQRVRKVTELPNNGGVKDERIYLGGFEIFRKHGGPIGANTVTLERETLHVMDDKQRIALVETRTLDTAGDDQAPLQLIRYQFGNHLGSASLELDEQAQIISYEEYTPYGSTSYQAVRNQTDTSKRYRYTGKERDEESGFYYHGARYYAVWLGRWTATDPIGIDDGLNMFSYSKNSPVTLIDLDGHQTLNSQRFTQPAGRHVPCSECHYEPDDSVRYKLAEPNITSSTATWLKGGEEIGNRLLAEYLEGKGGMVVLQNDEKVMERMFIFSLPKKEGQISESLLVQTRNRIYKHAETLAKGYLGDDANFRPDQVVRLKDEYENAELAQVKELFVSLEHFLNGAEEFYFSGDVEISVAEIEGQNWIQLHYVGEFIWEDTLNDNAHNRGDSFDNFLLEVATFGKAEPYKVKISWNAAFTVALPESGNPLSYGDWPSMESENLLWKKHLAYLEGLGIERREP